jgi:hypothetical protein
LAKINSRIRPDNARAFPAGLIRETQIMKVRFAKLAARLGRARRAWTFVFFLTLLAAGAAHAVGTPEQRRACTPDVYRLCPGEIPNVRAITACLRRQKASLSEACKAYFEQ